MSYVEVARGTHVDLSRLQQIANTVRGSGAIVLHLDTRVEIPFAPDIHLGPMIRLNLKALDLALRAIPGVHLDNPITFTESAGRGVLRIEARNNPVPLILGPIVAALIPWLIGLGIILTLILIGWVLLKKALGGSPVAIGIILLIVAAGLIYFALTKGKIPVPA